ncbi:hypothetical protein [Limnofasciculus baicalensis]|uniref:Uncharacterized protein n=1 Tax=Limnofasciculus baicalensis BBK-W-15 TaxID=2699891 RepID=A0AAE3KMQ2_9CYAN|nr:hypothetical protein [Limnofasciculus baicalensis]MCP2729031.1 hypothetical protein [Limnofasciculus baicalensis BBK-W-15]
MDKNNIRLTGDIEGSFYPSTQAEIVRNVVLQAPLKLNGGLFAQNITNIGGGSVNGPVLATAEITLSHPQPGSSPLKFLSGINATLSIAITESGKEIQETVVSHTSKASVVVQGDVVSDSVKLDNALIFGNVRSREVSLVNSIIVGSIFAEETLRLENSNFVALSGGRVILKGRNGCWLPYLTSLEPIQFADTILANGETMPAQLRYLSLCRSSQLGCGFKSGGIACEPFVTGKCGYHQVCLGSADIYPDQTEDGRTLYALNLAQRALNLAPIEQEIQQVELFLKQLMMYEHLDKSSQEQARESWAEKLRPEEKELLEMTVAML